MKMRILLSSIFLAVSMGAFAQQEITQHESVEYDDFNDRILANLHQNNKVNRSEAWFNYLSEMDALGTPISYIRNFLFPDSTVQTNFSSGMGFVWKHSMGQVLDPKSLYFNTYATPLYDVAKYTLDSLVIPYRYRRYQGNPDTLVVQVFINSQIQSNVDPGWGSGQSYATVPYDVTTRKGLNPAGEYTIVLDDDDTISASQGAIYVPVGIDFNAGDIVAMTYTFFPGNPHDVGDTITWYEPRFKKINAFIGYDAREEGYVNEAGFYNMDVFATSDQRYGTSTGWPDLYIPGTAYATNNNYNIHGDIGFKLTFDDYSGFEDLESGISYAVYPNPASDQVILDYDFRTGETLYFEMTNIVGEIVTTTPLSDGVDRKVIDVSNLSNGVYFYSLLHNGQRLGAKRLVVSH